MTTTLFAIDPSLAGAGYAVIDLSYADPRLIAAGVFETARAKIRKSVADDDMRRVRFIRRGLIAALRKHEPKLIAVELPSGGSQSANGIKALALAQALVACVVDEYLGDGQPIYITTLSATAALGIAPQQRTKKGETKKTNAEKSKDKKARKAAIASAVVERLGTHAWGCALGLGAFTREDVIDPQWEGAHDAAAIALAAWELPEVAAVRMIARHTSIDDVTRADLARREEVRRLAAP